MRETVRDDIAASAEDDPSDEPGSALPAKVGYCHPPLHSRFPPGVSGNPSGRPKESKNLKTLLHSILNEEISLQDGSQSRKVSKAEAIMRRLIVGALKGDQRDLHALFRLAEQTGQFEEKQEPLTAIKRIIVSWKSDDPRPKEPAQIPANNDINRE
jgi:hypothetical protein